MNDNDVRADEAEAEKNALVERADALVMERLVMERDSLLARVCDAERKVQKLELLLAFSQAVPWDDAGCAK